MVYFTNQQSGVYVLYLLLSPPLLLILFYPDF